MHSCKNSKIRTGDIIDFASQSFRVLVNNGDDGIVETWPDMKSTIIEFKWKRYGIKSRVIGYEPIQNHDIQSTSRKA